MDNIHFEYMIHRIYPAELHLNKANASDTETAFLTKTNRFIITYEGGSIYNGNILITQPTGTLEFYSLYGRKIGA